MQTILTSVLSIRAGAQNAVPSSNKAMPATHIDRADGFAKVLEEGFSELVQTLVTAPEAKPAKAKGPENAVPTEINADTQSEPEATNVDVLEIGARPQIGLEPVPTKPDADVDRQSVPPEALTQPDSKSADPVFEFRNHPRPVLEKDGAAALGAPKHVNSRHQSVAAALVNGVAHQPEMTPGPETTPRFERSAFDFNGNGPRHQNVTADRITQTEARLELPKSADLSTPLPAQTIKIRDAQTDAGLTQRTVTSEPPESAVHLGSHAPQPRLSVESRLSKPLSSAPGQSDSPGQKTGSLGPVLETEVVNAQSQKGVKHEAILHQGTRTEVPARTSERPERAAGPEPQTRAPAQVALVERSAFPTDMHLHAPSRNSVASATDQFRQFQSSAPITPAAKPIMSSTITKVIFDATASRSREPVEEFQLDLRPHIASAGTSQNALMPHRHEMPGHIPQQLAQAMHRNPDRPVEIALNPAELGRVRMTLTASETGIVVSILADRPETLELMRRNINDLSESFSDLGYEDIAFAFGQNENPSDASGDEQPGKTEVLSLDLGEHENDTAHPADKPRSTVATDGIDLRL